MLTEYWSVYKSDGTKYADCGWERDAQRLCEIDPTRTYRKNRFILDQVIDVTATIDKELPGQVGLPEYQKPLLEGGDDQPVNFQ